MVSVAQYNEYCGVGNWNDTGNMVQTQLDCLHLKDRLFKVGGTVKSVKISEVINDKELSLRSLPFSIQTTLTCLFGLTEPMCGKRNMTTCIYTGCHFHHSNKYLFEIKLDTKLDDSQQTVSISLTAVDKFRPLMTKLKSGTKLEFNATFVSGMGTGSLTLQLFSVWFEGEFYQLFEDLDEEEAMQHVQTRLLRSLKVTLQLFLEVLLGYTPLGFFKC